MKSFDDFKAWWDSLDDKAKSDKNLLDAAILAANMFDEFLEMKDALFKEDGRMVDMIAILKAEQDILRKLVYNYRYKEEDVVANFKEMLQLHEARIAFYEHQDEFSRARLFRMFDSHIPD